MEYIKQFFAPRGPCVKPCGAETAIIVKELRSLRAEIRETRDEVKKLQHPEKLHYHVPSEDSEDVWEKSIDRSESCTPHPSDADYVDWEEAKGRREGAWKHARRALMQEYIANGENLRVELAAVRKHLPAQLLNTSKPFLTACRPQLVRYKIIEPLKKFERPTYYTLTKQAVAEYFCRF